MKRALLILVAVFIVQACSTNSNTPEHICEVYMSCINNQKFDLAAQYVFDTTPSLIQLSPLLTKNYQYKSLTISNLDYGIDSSRVRVKSVIYYKDGTYLDTVFLLEKHNENAWKIKSI